MKKNLQNIFSNLSTIDYIFFVVIIAAFVLRVYKPLSYYYYGHDQDLASWFYLDVIKNGHLRLIGQETSVHGVFIGPIFYYLLIPFYLLFGGQPYGGLLLVTVLGLFSVFSIYFVFMSIINKNAGLIGAIIYAFSYIIIFTDREVVPTMPVYLWSIWYLYALYLVLAKKQKTAFILAGILFGLVWHLNMGLIIVAPLFFLAIIITRQKIIIKNTLYFVMAFLVPMMGYILFELKHGFIQTQAIILGSSSTAEVSLFSRFDRLMQIANTNARNMLWGDVFDVPDLWAHGLIILFFAYAVVKKVFQPKLAVLLIIWLMLYVSFFTLNAINVSEYYLNGMVVVWIFGISACLAYLVRHSRVFVIFVILIFIVINLYRFFRYPENKNGYLQKNEIAAFIAKDANDHNYPCVSVSYITDPGYELGYRYIFYINDLHVNKPSSMSPVYTIVFPHTKVDRIDKSFGALGLILPDYEKYTEKEVNESCSGNNENLTDPMFGFTK